MKSRIWGTVLALCMLVSVIIILGSVEQPAEAKQKITANILPLVSVRNVVAENNAGDIRIFSTIQPRWQSAIKATLTGELIQLSEKAQPGKWVEKGDELFQIESSTYEIAVYEAEQLIAQAKLDLLLAQKQAVLAQRDWQQSASVKAPPALALKMPQIDLARKTIAVGQSRLRAAKYQLSKARIKAPFSGLVIKCNVIPGQILTEGEEILQLLDNTHLETTALLSPNQRSQLPDNWREQQVSVQNMMGVEVAAILSHQQSLYIASQTYQYPIHFVFMDASRSLSGEFVQLVFSGRKVSNTLAIPQSALTRDGTVWYVDSTSHLRSFAAEVVYYVDDKVIIKAPEVPSRTSNTNGSLLATGYDWNIAIIPLAWFVAGDSVTMQPENQ